MYIVRSKVRKVPVFKTEKLEEAKEVFASRGYTEDKFEIVSAHGEKVNVESVETGRVDGGNTDVRESVPEDTNSELPGYSKYFTEPAADSSDQCDQQSEV